MTIIPADIDETARAIVEHYLIDLKLEDTNELRGLVTSMISLGMGAERYRCTNIAETVDPKLASRIWSNEV